MSDHDCAAVSDTVRADVGLERELIDRIDKYIAQIDALQRQQDEIALKRFIYESVVTDLKLSLQRHQSNYVNMQKANSA